MTIDQIFEKIVAELEAVRTGKGNNHLHETKHYSLFIAAFGGPYVCICNKANTSILAQIFDETQMLRFLKTAKR